MTDLLTNPVADLATWLAAQTWSEFAQSLAATYARRGRLSDAQIAAGERMRAKMQARDAARAATAEPQPHDAVTEPGFYMTADGQVWKVKRALAGHLYAMLRTEDGWEFARGAIRRLSAGERVTPEVAAAHGLRTGICLFCNAELDDADGLGAVVGVGPVCARKYLGMTQRQLAAHLGVQPQARRAPAMPAAAPVVASAPLGRLAEARRLAWEERRQGRVLTSTEQVLIAEVVDAIGPEMFYMDGELFAPNF